MTSPVSNPKAAPSYQRALNVAMRALLASPLHSLLSRRLLVIDVTGRRSGAVYHIPVGYVEHDGDLLIGSGGRWYRNLVAGQEVSILLRGRRRAARAEVVTDEARCAELYRYILAGNPIHGKYVGIGVEPDGTPNQSDLRRALAAGAAVVRLATTT
ncbi:nitroreductase family deazaflavin-dependent oxidoreductase [Mycobacterium sp.]|uniref:nitroreductase family deazaflavin-dependent oxidoreductase n=1 Tax=Mycobacterium sp. TaxID=1785 RepID=UPI002D340F6D|nr:nitroreductase family deazaflavin-dependent oxidoreductase [Mycobacterium sp.]HZA11121.1 nitroreductase family deazaflavin-dependent oxidoreductase [Mycobacterium sp.]